MLVTGQQCVRGDVCVCAPAGGLCEQRDRNEMAGEEPGHAPKICDVKPSMSPLVYNR